MITSIYPTITYHRTALRSKRLNSMLALSPGRPSRILHTLRLTAVLLSTRRPAQHDLYRKHPLAESSVPAHTETSQLTQQRHNGDERRQCQAASGSTREGATTGTCCSESSTCRGSITATTPAPNGAASHVASAPSPQPLHCYTEPSRLQFLLPPFQHPPHVYWQPSPASNQQLLPLLLIMLPLLHRLAAPSPDACNLSMKIKSSTMPSLGLISKIGSADAGFGYDLCAVLGSQSTGKSTLLNKLFGTNFDVMSESARQQTTKGIWMCKGLKMNVLVMDVEGTDGRERGEDQDFERKSALFSMASAEVLIVNLWEHQVGLYQGANMGLLKTVFEVNLGLFQAAKPKRLVPKTRPCSCSSFVTILVSHSTREPFCDYHG